MREVSSHEELARYLSEMFPAFAVQLREDPPQSYHHVVRLLAPQLSEYLDVSSESTLRHFCELLNVMAEAGGDMENAVATCLLEHASQTGIRKKVQPHLRPAAKRELR